MIQLTSHERSQLKRLQREHRRGDTALYIKATVLLMLDRGFTAEEVEEMLAVKVRTVYSYQERFRDLGLKRYLEDDRVPYQGKLTAEQCTQLVAELRQTLYISTKEVQQWIQQQFGRQLTRRAVAHLLNRLGFSYKRTRQRPSKADAEQQLAFLEQHQDLLAAPAADTLVFFNDAVHPQHNTAPDYGWIERGEDFELPANSGRARVNVNAALNAHDPTDVVAAAYDRINADSVTDLWSRQLVKYPDKTIINICDNARYYRSRQVQDWLALHPQVKVIFLPPYSPNLNLIERLWRFLRKEIINYYYYDTYDKFRDAVLGFFQNIRHYKMELQSLLTLKFRVVAG